MPKRLLDRQVRLIEHLTSARVIYGDQIGSPPSEVLHGIDPGLLRIEARFSHEKRMEKIAGVFSKTFELLGTKRQIIVREFVDAFPPTDISRIENARQFHEFLRGRWRREPPTPPYLADVAACELACAKVRVAAETSTAIAGAPDLPDSAVRRRPDIALLPCMFDIRCIFERDAEHAAPTERNTPLAVAAAPDSAGPRVFELAPEVFDLLASLDQWTDLAANDGSPEAAELIADLAVAGLLEMRR
jgi:hypothetical protein